VGGGGGGGGGGIGVGCGVGVGVCVCALREKLSFVCPFSSGVCLLFCLLLCF
jgi:hypothetical protein